MKISVFAYTPAINIYPYVSTSKHFSKLSYLYYIKVVALGSVLGLRVLIDFLVSDSR